MDLNIWKNKKVLVTGARAPVALEWCRALRKSGYLVYCADSLRMNLARFSNSVLKSFFLPEPSTSPTEYIETINLICRNHNIDLILPTCEEVFYLAWGKKNIHSKTEVLTNDIGLLKNIHSKYQFSHLVKDFDIRCPETRHIRYPEELHAYTDSSRNYVFKPEYSRFATETLIQPSKEQLDLIEISSIKPWVAQIYAEGVEYATHGFAKNGDLIFNSVYKPLYPFGKGSGTYFSPVSKPQIYRFVKDFCRTYNIHGQIGFDFIEEHSGKIFVIEANPRATSGIHLNTPLKTDKLSDNDHIKPSSRPLMIAPATIISQFIFQFKNVTSPKFWKDFFSAKDVVFSWRDLMPSIAQYLCLFEILCRALLRRQKPTSAATTDIEWNGESIES